MLRMHTLPAGVAARTARSAARFAASPGAAAGAGATLATADAV